MLPREWTAARGMGTIPPRVRLRPKRWWPLLAAAAILAAGRPARAQASSPALDILFHADLDGRFAAPRCDEPGAAPPDEAAIAAALAAARLQAPAALSLLGGNWAGPDPFGAALLGPGAVHADALAALFARAGYDAIAVGHNELALDDATLDALLPRLAAAGLPLLATNLTCDARRPACAAVRRELLIRRGGQATGVLATISPSVLPGIPPGRLAGLGLTDPAAAIREGVTRLRREGATRVVVLTDGPRDTRALDEMDALVRQLATGPAPDVLLGAGLADEETGRPVQLLRREGAPPAVGAPVGTAGVARVRWTAGAVAVETLAPATTPDAEIEARLRATDAAFCAVAARAVAPAGISGQLTRDDFVTYVLEVMRRRARAEIAVVNRAFVKRAPFPLTGALTEGDLQRALPYGAVIGAARVQGPVVESLIGAALSNPKLAAVGLTKDGGGLRVNGRPLDKARAYRVATIGFVAGGGDGIFPAHALPFAPLPGAPDLRASVADFLRTQTAAHDGDPTVSAKTDFGAPPVERALVVVMGDGEFDFADTSISNGPGYTDPQLTRAQQTSVKGEATLVTQLRHPRHELDGRFDAQYGWTRTQPAGMPAVAGESIDLITAIATYSYRGLRDWRRFPKPAIPDPYARLWLESEFTRPAVTATQARDYHHLQLTPTAGAQLTLTPRLKVRGGAGAQSELLASGAAGRWQAVIEAGATLDPTALATWGALAVRLEGLVNYDFVDPTDTRQHQLRGNTKLSVPLMPTLFLTIGLDVFAAQRKALGWGASYDTTIGLRLHTDVAHQPL
ncbi:MAG TPA: 5'-nucleotidase C-terminal domain-containing protein [Polyangia bacterium]|nr:5'-nucleotidase C-terminal domain-containing protein [Polyangia bacterium]